MKPVIVQVVQHLSPGGIETMALDLMQQMSPCADVHIVSLEGTASDLFQRWPRLRGHERKLHFLGKPPGMNMTLVLELSQLFKEMRASAVHTHHIGPLFYGGLAAKLAGISVHVHTEHDAWHLEDEGNRRLQRIMLRTLRPTLVADCEEVAQQLKHHFPFVSPRVILNGIDTNRFVPADEATRTHARKELGLPQDALLIGCAARLETVKGHRFLLEALSRSRTPLSLVLAGDGTQREWLQAHAYRLGIASRIHFLGALSEMVPFYHAIDLFCLPSLKEGLPLSPLEAQSCGVPAVVSRVGGCSQVVCPKTGELVLPANVGNLVSALIRFHHRQQYRQLSPRDFVLRTGNLKRTTDAYLQLLMQRKPLEV